MKRCPHCGQVLPSTNLIKTFRKSQRPPMSQKQLAHAVGVDRVTVARWEVGMRNVGAEQLAAVATVTGIPRAKLRPDLAALLGGNGRKP